MDLLLFLLCVELTPWVHKVAKAGCLEKSGWFSESQCLPKKKKIKKKLVYKSVYVSISTLLQNVKYSKNNLQE